MLALLPTFIVTYLFLLYFQCLIFSSKFEITNHGVYDDYISMVHALLHLLIFNGRAKMKLAIMAFLYCAEFVKNSVGICSLSSTNQNV